jgi:hypothetical protein
MKRQVFLPAFFIPPLPSAVNQVQYPASEKEK